MRDVGYRLEWRVKAEEGGPVPPFDFRWEVAADPGSLRLAAERRSAEAWNAEFRVVSAGGPGVYTRLAGIRSWTGDGLPDADATSVWRREDDRAFHLAAMTGGLRRHLMRAVARDVIGGREARLVLEFAEGLRRH